VAESLGFAAVAASPSAADAAAIEAIGLTKSFGERVALRDVGFAAAAGELLAVIGPNGAGKTTLLSLLAGIREPDAGEIRLPRGEVGFVPQQAALYRRLTVAENLRLFARLEEVDDVEATVERMLAQTDLADRRDDQAGTLSGGNQQRINIAIGLLSDPAVLLLDEPSTGLDPRQRSRLWEFVLGLAGAGTTVIFSTHNIAEAERYGGRILVLADGQGLFDGSIEQFNAAAPAAEAETAAGDFESAFVRFLAERGH
jgi:ABC-2 type transport system ATP-binding protein